MSRWCRGRLCRTGRRTDRRCSSGPPAFRVFDDDQLDRTVSGVIGGPVNTGSCPRHRNLQRDDAAAHADAIRHAELRRRSVRPGALVEQALLGVIVVADRERHRDAEVAIEIEVVARLTSKPPPWQTIIYGCG